MSKKDPGYLRFALVGFCRLYMGTNNIKKAFTLAPFSEWAMINYLLFIVGLMLVAIVIPCIYMANKILKEKKAEEARVAEEKLAKKQSEYRYDEEEFASEGNKSEE